MNLRSITLEDHPGLILFWKKNYFVNELDSFEKFKIFLSKNPRLSILMEDRGETVGTILGSFDGRRGYIQKLVVRKDFRNIGIGKKLVKEAVKRLHRAGALYIPVRCEENTLGFYEKCGFKKTNQVSLGLNLK